MTRNRDYTGLVRTPASMTWLIRQRATIQGSIERKQRRIQRHREEVSVLKQQLRAVDVVVRAHEVAVDPEAVKAVKSPRPRVGPHGELGRFLVSELKLANGKPVPATELAIGFLKHLQMEVNMINLKDFRSRIRWRLKDLAAEGRVVARHVADESGRIIEGYWSFPLIDPET